MASRRPQIVAFGGGGFSMESGNTLLDDHVLALTGVPRPRVCFLPTASGDADHYIVRFYRAFAASHCEPSHISLFRRETSVADPGGHLLAQDLIYVGGGSVVSLLGTWRAHGLDIALREAWLSGVLLCGGSAGSLCWFSEAVSGFHRGEPRRVSGLGLLPWSNAVHYESEGGRRQAFHAAIGAGMPLATRPTTGRLSTLSEASWPRWSPRSPALRPSSSQRTSAVACPSASCRLAISVTRPLSARLAPGASPKIQRR